MPDQCQKSILLSGRLHCALCYISFCFVVHCVVVHYIVRWGTLRGGTFMLHCDLGSLHCIVLCNKLNGALW